jgi:hypothetical protein
MLCGCLVAMATVAIAAEEKKGGTHEGTVVKTEEGKLVMNDKAGKEHSHMIGKDAKVTLDGESSKLTDLKKGDKVTVTTDDSGKVTKIEAKRDAKK